MTDLLDYSPTTQRTQPAPVDLAAVKTRQQAMWASGDFAVIGTTLQIVGESLAEALDLQAGSRVVDVACGNGNATLAAARRFCKVTGLDYVPSLLGRAAERAKAERLDVELVAGDAENLPFEDGAFDAALSTFGVMFAPDQARTAQELTRVVRPGGKIGLANWTPEGFVGGLLKTVSKHVPPPAGVASPLEWGKPDRLRELFPQARAVSVERKNFVFRYESPAHFVDVFRRYYGPTFKAFGALDGAGQTRLAADIIDMSSRYARSSSTFVVPAEYVEVVVEV